jgi:hypothetical protein
MKRDLITYLTENNISLGMDEGQTEVRFINEKMGHGRFALKNLYKDNIVYRMGGFWIERSDRMHILETLGQDIVIYADGGWFFEGGLKPELIGTINHSCEPNCYIEDFRLLRALKDIAKEEEVTIDYPTIIMHDDIILEECDCGTPSCRGRIKGTDWLTYKLVEKYDYKVAQQVIRNWEESAKAFSYKTKRSKDLPI